MTRTKVLAVAIFLAIWFLAVVVLSWLPSWVTVAVVVLLLLDFVFGGEKR